MLRRIFTVICLLTCLAVCTLPALAQAPTGVEVHTSGSGTLDITWTAVTGASSYKVYCYTQSGGPYGTAASVANTYTHKYYNSLNDTITYYCVVSTVISGVESAKSTEVSACSGATQLAAPTGVTATASSGQVALSWNSVSGATGYDIYRTPNTPGDDSGICFAPVSGTSYTDTAVANGTTYTYQVAAVKATGEGNACGPLVVTPLAPPALTAEATANASGAEIDLAWTASAGATSYTLLRSATSGGEGMTAYQSGIAGTTYNDVGLAANTTYYYEIEAVAGGSTSAPSGEVSAKTGSALLSASTLSVVSGAYTNGQIPLTWTSVSGASYYDVYRNANNDSSQNTDSSGFYARVMSGTTYTDARVVNGTNYTYRVAAVSANGQGNFSNSLTVSALAAPTLTATASSATQVNVTWTSSSGATSYHIDYSATSNLGPWTYLAAPTGTSYTQTGLSQGTNYWYRVQALAANSNSGSSNAALAVTYPGAPTGLTATAGNGLINLSWTAPASGHVGTYNLYRSTTLGGEGSAPYLTGLTATSYTDPGVTAGTTYYYKITAADDLSQESAQSGEASATPTNSGLSSVSQAYVIEGGSHILLGWRPVSGASSYNLYRSVAGSAFTRIQQNITTSTSFGGTVITAYDNSVSNGEPMTYYVTAVASSEGAASFLIPATANLTTSVPALQYPSADAGMYGASASIAFNPDSYDSGAISLVNLYRSTTSGMELSSAPAAAFQSASALTFPPDGRRAVQDSNSLTQNTSYYYVAAGAAGSFSSPISYYTEGPVSSEVSYVPGATVLPAPSVNPLTYGNFTATLSWSAVSGAAYYNVYQVNTIDTNNDQQTLVVAQTTGTTFNLTNVHYSDGSLPQANSTFVAAVNSNAEGALPTALNINLSGFGLKPVPSTITIARGQHGSVTVAMPAASNTYTASSLDFTGPVTLSVSGMPTGVTAWPDPVTPTVALSDILGGSTSFANYSEGSTLFLSVGSGVTPGTYPLTITGIAGTGASYAFTQSVTVTLIVT